MIMGMDMLDIVMIRRLRNMDIPMNTWSMLVSCSRLQQTVIRLGQSYIRDLVGDREADWIGKFAERDLPDYSGRDWTDRAFTIGIGGYVCSLTTWILYWSFNNCRWKNADF
jgi:hypothetical protein